MLDALDSNCSIQIQNLIHCFPEATLLNLRQTESQRSNGFSNCLRYFKDTFGKYRFTIEFSKGGMVCINSSLFGINNTNYRFYHHKLRKTD